MLKGAAYLIHRISVNAGNLQGVMEKLELACNGKWDLWALAIQTQIDLLSAKWLNPNSDGSGVLFIVWPDKKKLPKGVKLKKVTPSEMKKCKNDFRRNMDIGDILSSFGFVGVQ
jgi:hypothetical protein